MARRAGIKGKGRILEGWDLPPSTRRKEMSRRLPGRGRGSGRAGEKAGQLTDSGGHRALRRTVARAGMQPRVVTFGDALGDRGVLP